MILSLWLLAAAAGLTPAGAVSVTDVWARPTPPGTSVGAVYFTLHNSGTHPERLQGASSPIAAQVEMHENRLVQGVMQMREVAGVDIAPGATVKSEPGGLHVMLLGLHQQLVPGMHFAVNLHFRNGGDVPIEAVVGGPP